MRLARIHAGGLLAVAIQAAPAQSRVPVVDLANPTARSAETVGVVLGVRQLPGNRLLVNDAGRRQVRVFDSTLATSRVVIDSAAGTGKSYGPISAPLIAYPGDSSLFLDFSSQSLLVLDPRGEVSRVMSLPRQSDILAILGSRAYADDKGRLVYRGRAPVARVPAAPGKEPGPFVQVDTAPIVRADFDTRLTDTIGRVKMPTPSRANAVDGPDGKVTLHVTINPVQVIDDWALLSDGTLAFVRGHDYHVDVLSPSGTMSSAAKLAYDWRRLTDEDKQHLIDSTRAARDSMARMASQSAARGGSGASPAGNAAFEAGFAVGRAMAGGGGGAAPVAIPLGEGGRGGPGSITQVTDFVPLKDIADYYPPIRAGAVIPDLDGNLWVLPTTSTESKGGELVYDVVNNRGDLAQRVRLPAGRLLAGFGRGGVVYLLTGDRSKGFTIERYRITGGANVRQD